jgi:hypothetical protein
MMYIIMTDESISKIKESRPSTKKLDKNGKAIAEASKTEYNTYELDPSGQEQSVSAKARDAGGSLRDLIYSAIKKTKNVAEEKTRHIRAQSLERKSKEDAEDIQALHSKIDKVNIVFEETMAEIPKESYDVQEKLLIAYKKLLEEQINIINARLHMAKRLKSSYRIPFLNVNIT